MIVSVSVIGGIMAGSALLGQHILLRKQHKELAVLVSGPEIVVPLVDIEEEPIFPHLKVIPGGKTDKVEGEPKGD